RLSRAPWHGWSPANRWRNSSRIVGHARLERRAVIRIEWTARTAPCQRGVPLESPMEHRALDQLAPIAKVVSFDPAPSRAERRVRLRRLATLIGSPDGP